jgi:hypothetical protein
VKADSLLEESAIRGRPSLHQRQWNRQIFQPEIPMKLLKQFILTPLLAVTLSSTGVSCASGPNAQTGTVVGGLGGAAVGGIIGHQSGRSLEGAAIGGVLGALGGNMIGDAQDQRNYYYSRGYYPRRYAYRY